MKNMIRPVLLAALVAACPLLVAEQDEEFTAWMKKVNTASGMLRKMEQKTGKQAVSAGEMMGGAYEQMIGFWRQREARDAVKWSEEGKAWAAQLATAASSGDAAQAAAAAEGLGKTCMPCHQKYRVKAADGTYRLQMPAPGAPDPRPATPSPAH